MSEKITLSGIQLKVLILEDSLYDLELIRELLTDAGYVLDLTHAENEASLTIALMENRYDIILSDFSLPGFNAFGALHIRNEYCPEVPFICISGSIGEETAIELLKLGAVDYVLKDRPERLPFAVKRALDKAKEELEFKQVVRELQESKIRFEQVADDAQEWIWEVDENGLYTYASPVVQSLLGYSAEELVGKKYFYDFFTPDKKEDMRKEVLEAFSRRESFRHFQNTNVHRDGHLLTLSTSGSPIFDMNGQFKGYRGVDSDITERTKILEELVLAKEKAEESDNLKTAFINNISHEIRTPLNSILGFGQFLSEADLSPEQRKEYFTIIENASRRLINTVSDYIDIARIVSGNMEVHQNGFQLSSFFRELTEDTKHACLVKNIGFEIEFPTKDPDMILYSDQEFVGKILQTLLDNALKFTTEGIIRCGYQFKSDEIEFFVHDTGCGISSKKLDNIFEMFSQENPTNTRGHEGSGLGLTIAKGLVQMLGGRIGVTSEKGKGSSFTFTLPRTLQSNLEQIGDAKSPTTADWNRPLVLIAEDDDSNYMYLKVLLNMIGCDFLYAANGAEAVERCQQNPQISLVLMDIKMPVMNGLEATSRIHEFRPELPIIATTAFSQTGDEHRFLTAGCNGYLAKPINKDNLSKLVQKFSKIKP